MKPYIVGITGGSASGKTSFLKSLVNSFSEDEICLISQDNYYKNNEHIKKDENGIENYDLPETIDHITYAHHINELSKGKTVYQREYVFNNPNLVPKMLTFKSAPIIVVEGIFVLYFKEIFDQIDLKIFVDAKEHLMIKRRIIRDNLERGYDLADVLYRWENHVAPAYAKFIEPFKYEADIIVNNNTHFKKGLDVVTTYLKTKLEE
jgi:uridine kinase